MGRGFCVCESWRLINPIGDGVLQLELKDRPVNPESEALVLQFHFILSKSNLRLLSCIERSLTSWDKQLAISSSSSDWFLIAFVGRSVCVLASDVLVAFVGRSVCVLASDLLVAFVGRSVCVLVSDVLLDFPPRFLIFLNCISWGSVNYFQN